MTSQDDIARESRKTEKHLEKNLGLFTREQTRQVWLVVACLWEITVWTLLGTGPIKER